MQINTIDSINNTENKEKSVVQKLLELIIRRSFLLTIIVILSLVGGFVYDRVRTRCFYSYHQIGFTAQSTNIFLLKNGVEQIDVDGNYIIKENDSANISIAIKYAKTVEDFCKTGVVVDRADFYYQQFLNEYKKAVETNQNVKRSDFIKQYIDSVNRVNLLDEDLTPKKTYQLSIYENSTNTLVKKEATFIGKEDSLLKFQFDNNETKLLPRFNDATRVEGSIRFINYLPYDEYVVDENKKENTYIIQANVFTESDKDTSNRNFTFHLGYSDKSTQLADEKVRFIVLAANQEVKEYADGYDPTLKRETAISYKYFDIVKISLGDLGYSSSAVDLSLMKTLVLFGAGGLIFGLVFIYLLSVLDSKMSDKDDLERLAGAPCFTLIERIEKEEW